MGLKERIKRLEGSRDPYPPCPECGGRIVFEEHQPEDGTVTYPEGDRPCSRCNNAGFGDAPGKIVVVSCA